MTENDKAGTNYWDDIWSNVKLPNIFDENNQSLDNHVNLNFHAFFKKLFKDQKGFSILEIGCANSIWPIYFHQHFNADVYGLDYSELGCEKSRELLKHHQIPGKIYCADLFSPPSDLLQKFDVVVSFGVVEHFEDTAQCLNACAALVKPGGLLLTFIPNMPGIVGCLQKIVDRNIYNVHMPLTQRLLLDSHHKSFEHPVYCNYFMSINLSVVNSGDFSSHQLNGLLRHVLSGISKIVWILEKMGLKMPKNRWTSPYLVAVARCTGI